MSIADPWQSILRQIEPNYDKIYEIMYNPPEVKFDIYKKGKKHVLALSMDYFEESLTFNQVEHMGHNLDNAVEWLVEKLQDRQDVRRTSWAIWEFTDKREAEKIVTLFYLSCPE